MTIVLNENEWARDMIESKSLGGKPSETLRRIARYYLDEGYSKKKVRERLETFIIRCDPSASITKWSGAIERAVNKASDNAAIHIDGVSVSVPEMKKINALKSKQARRLAFTLLCLAKYWDKVAPNSDHWVNMSDSDIMSIANINTSIKRQSLLYSVLRDEGLIRFSKKVDNTNVRVCFIEDGEVAYTVTDYRNLGYTYMHINGDKKYMRCQNCGIIFRNDNYIPEELSQVGCGRPREYCNQCASELNLRRKVNAVMRPNVTASISSGR